MVGTGVEVACRWRNQVLKGQAVLALVLTSELANKSDISGNCG